MNSKLKTALLFVVTLAVVIIVLWYPYQTTGIPKWKLQVLDREGYVAAHAPIRQEWLDPIEDGIVRSDGGDSDANGEVMFPARTLHNRLVLGFAPRHPSTRVFVCWHEQYGSLEWDGVPNILPKILKLKSGSCPFG